MILENAETPELKFELENFQYLDANREQVNGILSFKLGEHENFDIFKPGDYFLSVNGQPKFSFLENLSISKPETGLLLTWEAKKMINYLTPSA